VTRLYVQARAAGTFEASTVARLTQHQRWQCQQHSSGSRNAVPTHVAGHLQVLHFCHGRNRVLDCIPWQGDVTPALDVGLVLVILAPQFLHLRARRQ
jgi:hypothetical protein